MLHRSLITLVLLLVVGGCAGDEPPAATSDATADEVVLSWLGALDPLDLEVLRATTHPPNVALVAGAENDFTVEQMAGVVDGGLPTATLRSYWSTFADSFGAFLGVDAAAASVTSVTEFQVDDTTFAAVTVAVAGQESEIIAQRIDDQWVVDLLAIAGPALSVQIRRLVAAVVDEADDAVAFSYASMAVRSLNAALTRDPTNRALELELEAIEDLPIDLSR